MLSNSKMIILGNLVGSSTKLEQKCVVWPDCVVAIGLQKPIADNWHSVVDMLVSMKLVSQTNMILRTVNLATVAALDLKYT
jgi:hypothetical protein